MSPEKQRLGTYVAKLLIFLGFSPRVSGYGYLKEMITIRYSDCNLKLSQTYPLISKSFGYPEDAIQTAVRTALKNAFNQGGNKQLETLLGIKLSQAEYVLSPREFLGLIEVYLKYYWDGSLDIKVQ